MDIDPPTGYEKTKKQQNDKKTKIHPVSFLSASTTHGRYDNICRILFLIIIMINIFD